MHNHIRSAVLLLIAALEPVSAQAALIDVSDVEILAFGSFKTQNRAELTDSDTKSAPLGSLTRAEVLVLAEGVQGMPFPNIPTTQTRPFASSAADANGFFGVGVNGFFFQNSLPPHELVASGSSGQSITNNSEFPISMDVDFFIPAPTLQFFGVGNSFPVGADPDRDAKATARITLSTILTHPDGTTADKVLLDYGLFTLREPLSGVFQAFPTSSDGVGLARFDEPDGSFGFLLPDLEATDIGLGEIGPGDTLEFTYDYFASASTGFGETGIFAAIGDPFNLSVGGGRFEVQVIPEPATWALLAAGLLVVRFGARARAQRRLGYIHGKTVGSN